MKKILAAVDFRDSTREVIDFVKKISSQLNAELLIVHSEVIESYLNTIVSELHQQPSLELVKEQKEILKKKMKKIKDELTEYGIKVTCQLLEGPTVQTILEEADNFHAELIVIGSHKHGSFYNLLMGSVHDSLISHSSIPILVIPPVNKVKDK